MNIIHFKNQFEFIEFLEINNQSDEGIWIKFDKRKSKDKLTPDQALKAALCYGWIDGQIKSLDDDFYLKYFTKRRNKSNWSERNKKLANELIANKLMKPSGFKEIEKAKKDGRWEKKDFELKETAIEDFAQLIKTYSLAYENFKKMSPSVQKTYATSYYYLKNESSRLSRLEKIIKRLEENLKPM
ncbi:MAG: hypothetical protein CVV60_02845 [Tenericutes bacterium HGW-Tenericutes-5]|jgi:uncharacterized protein YdeI (YjbR/CyaY-like superfamily)|nr:MAG: hypothetical protein CVV60_02845 [Tenericutes bacterium HGW-Tenericutes-5]